MIYVFDTSAFSMLFKNYYRDRFPSLWSLFDELVEDGRIVSTREAGREVLACYIPPLLEWHENHKHLFETPNAEEALFIAKIYSSPHFQQNIEQKKLLKGGYNADPFLIAQAAVLKGTVVTAEKFKPNATKIPNICKHFDVPCMSTEQFMEAEEWTF